MQIIYPTTTQKTIHPVAIFKQGLGVYKNNLFLFCGIYLLINLPVQLTEVIKIVFFSKANTTSFLQTTYALLMYALIFFLGSWGNISWILAARNTLQGTPLGILKTIGAAKDYFLYYVGTMLLLFFINTLIFIVGIVCLAGSIGLALKIKNLIFFIFALIALVAMLCAFVYCLIRLSLSATACVIEKLRPIASLKQSHRAIAPFVNPVVGAGGLLILLSSLAYIPFIVIASTLKSANLQQASLGWVGYAFLANGVLAPLWAIVFVILYNKLKEPT